jgi:hypothetical protein
MTDSFAAPAVPPTPPARVVAGVWLMIANIAVQVVGLVVSLANRNEIVDALVRSNKTGIDATTLRQTADTTAAASIAVGVIVIVLYALLALQVRRAKKWARTTTVVLAAFGLLYLLVALSPSTIAPMRIVDVVEFAMNVGILFVLAGSAVSAYFTQPPTLSEQT